MAVDISTLPVAPLGSEPVVAAWAAGATTSSALVQATLWRCGRDVREYGAVGDGQTDDSTAVAAAIASVENAGGGIVYFPPGVYVVGQVAVTGNGVTILGAGAACSTLRANGATTPVVSVSGVSGFGFHNLSVDCASLSGVGIRLNAVSRATLSGFSVASVRQTTGPATGVQIVGDCHDVRVFDFLIDGVDGVVDGVARGVRIHKGSGEATSTGIKVIGGTIRNVAPVADGDGIVVQDWPDTASLDIEIAHVSFESCLKRAVKIQAPDVRVHDCTVSRPFAALGSDAGYAAVSVYASRAIVSNIQGVSVASNAHVEIGAEGLTIEDVVVTGCVIAGDSANAQPTCDAVALVADATVRRIVVSGNHFGVVRYGLRLASDVIEGVAVSGNVFDEVDGGSAVILQHVTSLADVAVVGNVVLGGVSNWFIRNDAAAGTVDRLTVAGNACLAPFGFASLPAPAAIVGNSDAVTQTGVPVTAAGIHAALVNLGLISA